MPLFEFTYAQKVKQPDGREIDIPPSNFLRSTGPTLQVSVSITSESLAAMQSKGMAIPQAISGGALIDTGASLTAIDDSVCQGLQLPPIGETFMGHAGGGEKRFLYAVQLSFPGTNLPNIQTFNAVSVNLTSQKHHIVLLGRDVLQHMKFVYNGPAGRIELAF